MQDGGMMGGDMSGMHGMMQMMQQMGPMMEACTEMLQAMSDDPSQTMPDQKGQTTCGPRSSARTALIPTCTDQNSCAHWRHPMEAMRSGWSISLFQASQQ